MGLSKSNNNEDPPEFGAAADGDADRNMVLGKRLVFLNICLLIVVFTKSESSFLS